MPEGMADKEALMIGESVAGDGCRDLRDLYSGLFLGQLRDLLCVQMSIEQCLEHEAAGYTEDVRPHVPSLTFASSRTFCTRLRSREFSPINCRRLRVRSRSSRIASGGMKLGRIIP